MKDHFVHINKVATCLTSFVGPFGKVIHKSVAVTIMAFWQISKINAKLLPCIRNWNQIKQWRWLVKFTLICWQPHIISPVNLTCTCNVVMYRFSYPVTYILIGSFPVGSQGDFECCVITSKMTSSYSVVVAGFLTWFPHLLQLNIRYMRIWQVMSE